MAQPSQNPASTPPIETRRALGGVFVRRECWTLSLTAKIIILAICISVTWAGIRFVQPFLAVTKPVQGQLLVVEGWIPRYGLQQAVSVFRSGHYQRMVTSGCTRMNDLDGLTATNPAVAAAIQVQRYGMDAALVTAVPCPIELKDRTYNSALAVREWCEKSGVSTVSVDVLTSGPHARRSRLLFQAAFGSKTKVGVIAIEDRSYDPAHWWRSSEGVRDVVGEGLAYLYARILFHPSGPGLESSGDHQNAGAHGEVSSATQKALRVPSAGTQ